MSYQLPPLIWLRAFEAAARRTSFTAAAEELQLTQAAISYQVRSLEKHLGFPLFERLPRSLRLTDMGKAYLPAVRKAFDELSATTVGLFGPKRDKSVTVRATISFAVLWLGPRLKNFRQKYPEVNIRLCTSIWAEGSSEDEMDLEIRFGDGHWSGFNVELLCHDKIIPVCSPLLEEKLEPGSDNLLHIMGSEDVWKRWFESHGPEEYDFVKGVRVDNSLTALEMAATGSGFTAVQKCFAEPYLENGRLIRPSKHELPALQSHYLLMPESQSRPKPEVIWFRDWLWAEAKAYFK
ncbi:LysR substrate-binding domain-containing protein [Kiloniella laminariae]|uniref:LysR substrate-binding domain-containing protein n=1 Tax=Kiloniella laminariae TaxID=454162 RepID=A0ABT4LMC7_9PROT|nr:LysR substrate-binding domain-containing protein [Kiloniella laminariae]MCZ4282264.1 LysR substrate-binding domain-containing protein [Kiloniella laminariae]